jgi:hypothetical protein
LRLFEFLTEAVGRAFEDRMLEDVRKMQKSGVREERAVFRKNTIG